MSEHRHYTFDALLTGVLRAREHHSLDLLLVCIFAIAALALNLGSFAFLVAFGLAVFHLTLTVLTGFTKRNVISLRFHAQVEAAVLLGLVFLSVFTMFESSRANAFFALMAGSLACIWALSDYRDQRNQNII